MKQLDFLMIDVLASFPNKVGEHLIDAINSHMIAKESVVQVFRNECLEKKPSYRVINGCLNVLISQLFNRKIDYAIEVLPNIKICLRDNRKIIRRLASEVLIRLTFSLWLEFFVSSSNAKSYLEKFKKIVNKEDLYQSAETLRIFRDNKFFGRVIFEHYGVKFNILDTKEPKNKFDTILLKIFT